MKTTFKSSEIAHVWAHQSAPHGSSPGAMSFNGPAFLSYGTEIARHITHAGKLAVLVNDTSYSVSTSKHQGKIRQAIPSDVPTFKIGGIGRGCSLLNISGAQLFEYAISEAADQQSKSTKARLNKDWYAARSLEWLESAREISTFFGLRRKVDSKAIERLQSVKARAEKQAARKAAESLARIISEQSANFEGWKTGGHEYFQSEKFPIAFRVEGDELVSTLGARVPLHDAKAAYRFARAHKAGWHTNGETCPVGHYQLNSISEAGIVAGCHRISWDEMERLAPVLA